ncbi:MAG TPA: O-antigen ligase family protein [Rhizobiaceae bacterium]
MTTSRFAIVAIYVLVALSMWSPDAEAASGGMVIMARYALFVSTSMAIVLHTCMTKGIVISRSPDWLLLIGFLLYTSLSVLWSDGGMNAAIKAMLIFSALLVSVSMANAAGLDTLLRIYYNAMGVFIILSLLVVIFYPEQGIETGWLLEGDWRGIAGQKNGLGNVAALVFVASLVLPLTRRADGSRTMLAWFTRLSMIVMSAVCLLNSGSRGALLSAGIGLGAVLASRAPRALQRVGLVTLVLLAIPVIHLALTTFEINADKIDVLGTRIDSNSRTTLWFYGLEQLAGRELLGFGVGGFWTPGRITAFRDVHGWVLDNFHNGYVTILVEGGFVGIALLLLAIGFVLLLYLVAIGNLRDPYVALAFGYTAMYVIGNVVENEIGRSTSLTFIMFLAISFALRLHLSRLLTPAYGSGPRLVPAVPPTLS